LVDTVLVIFARLVGRGGYLSGYRLGSSLTIEIVYIPRDIHPRTGDRDGDVDLLAVLHLGFLMCRSCFGSTVVGKFLCLAEILDGLLATGSAGVRLDVAVRRAVADPVDFVLDLVVRLVDWGNESVIMLVFDPSN
jgi:hypothetical protein